MNIKKRMKGRKNIHTCTEITYILVQLSPDKKSKNREIKRRRQLSQNIGSADTSVLFATSRHRKATEIVLTK